MSVKLEYQLPSYAIKHIEKIKILFAVNSETGEHESFVPLSMYLELLDKLENLACKQSKNELSNGADV